MANEHGDKRLEQAIVSLAEAAAAKREVGLIAGILVMHVDLLERLVQKNVITTRDLAEHISRIETAAARNPVDSPARDVLGDLALQLRNAFTKQSAAN